MERGQIESGGPISHSTRVNHRTPWRKSENRDRPESTRLNRQTEIVNRPNLDADPAGLGREKIENSADESRNPAALTRTKWPPRERCRWVVYVKMYGSYGGFWWFLKKMSKIRMCLMVCEHSDSFVLMVDSEIKRNKWGLIFLCRSVGTASDGNRFRWKTKTAFMGHYKQYWTVKTRLSVENMLSYHKNLFFAPGTCSFYIS